MDDGSQGKIYTYFHETSVMVDNLEEAVETYGNNFGIWPRPQFPLLEQPEVGCRVAFCLVSDFALAHTYFTIVQPIATDTKWWLKRKYDEQGPSLPHHYHCTCLAVEDLDILIRHFDSYKIPYNIATEILNPEEHIHIPGRRLFVGRPKNDPFGYDPQYDLNACLEILSVKENALWNLPLWPAPPVDSLPPGSFVKIESWSVLVEDIFKAIQIFGRNFFLWPSPNATVRDIPEEGAKSVKIAVGQPQSAKLEIVAPYNFNKPAGKYFKEHGNRMYTIRLLAKDLDARLRNLDSKHVAYDVKGPTETLKYKRAWIDPRHTMGANLEFADYDQFVSSQGLG